LDATFPNRWIERDGPTPITEDMLENTWREIDYRLDVLRATKGAHV